MPDNLINLSQWRTQFLKAHVQSLSAPEGGDFLSSETVVLISGPALPNPAVDGTNWLTKTVPIALVQNVQIAQQKNLQQIFEIGSRRPYFIPGRTYISCSIARILFDGPSLMYALYMKNVDNNNLVSLSATGWPPQTATNIGDIERPAVPFTANSATNPELNGSLSDPGQFFINLASSFFNKPHGLGFILYDAEQEPYGGFYLQQCYIQDHRFGIASQQTVLVENVTIRASDMFPIHATSI